MPQPILLDVVIMLFEKYICGDGFRKGTYWGLARVEHV
jgi:hypothetical protein